MKHSNQQSRQNPRISLRQQLRARRLGLTTSARSRFDEAIQQHILQLLESRNACSIACYWSFNGEPDITPLCKQWLAHGGTIALPRVPEQRHRQMVFHSWQADTKLTTNCFGIPEPEDSVVIPISGFDMMLIPLVGYDRFGNRIGMGAGYYDRYLEPVRESERPLRVGVAYSLQEIAPIQKNSWDIPLHGLVNELGWFTFI